MAEQQNSDTDVHTQSFNPRAAHASTKNKERWQLTEVENGKVRDQHGDVWTSAAKAYKNADFINSRQARNLRILAEHMETEDRLNRFNLHHTILVFCSARGRSKEQWQVQLKNAEKQLKEAQTPEEKKKAEDNHLRVRRLEWMCEFYAKTRDLCQKLATWSKEQPIPFHICSGGGPGLMEAANEGAHRAGAKSIGMAISVPFEPGLNKFVSNDLAFEFHYFFTRKFWMSYPARALIVSPGGFGTCDELFELLTLQQTKKMHDIPIVCLGVDFWKKVINVEAMVEFGTVSPRDAERIFFTDSVEEAFNHITNGLKEFMSKATAPGGKGTKPLPRQVADN